MVYSPLLQSYESQTLNQLLLCPSGHPLTTCPLPHHHFRTAEQEGALRIIVDEKAQWVRSLAVHSHRKNKIGTSHSEVVHS